MEQKKKIGRPRNLDRVRASVNMDRDLFEWTADKKRSDMINRLLRKEKDKAKRK